MKQWNCAINLSIVSIVVFKFNGSGNPLNMITDDFIDMINSDHFILPIGNNHKLIW